MYTLAQMVVRGPGGVHLVRNVTMVGKRWKINESRWRESFLFFFLLALIGLALAQHCGRSLFDTAVCRC